MCTTDTTDAPNKEAASDSPLTVVGIGASAGGLAAIEEFFSRMPPDTDLGMAFVVVQHLAPEHKSMLAELVQRVTSLRVIEVTDGMKVESNGVYIIPPNKDMTLANRTLQLHPQSSQRGLRLPIDFFFRSLAEAQRERAICVVLSGTGNDGTAGARAIKGAGGMVMAQTPESTTYDGMPRSVIATGLVDYVLLPSEMPSQLLAYVYRVYGSQPGPISQANADVENTLKKICAVLRSKTGHDFSEYKQNTLIRRVERRMALNRIEQAELYLSFLRTSPIEIEALFYDLLIGVTSFFRDPEAFAAVEAQVIPRLLTAKEDGDVVRVWVCGCSTGEEVYSIAILLQERLEQIKQHIKVQLFATDIDGRAIDQARSGVFSGSIATDVSPERLSRFFSFEPSTGTFRIVKSIRDLIIFSEQNVIKDPPFSRLDLICCRNLLIYMNADLQRRLFPLFHYALNRDGLLFLGTSETVGDNTPLFEPIDRKWKIFARQENDSTALPLRLGDQMPRFPVGLPAARTLGGAGRLPLDRLSVRQVTEQALLHHYAQAALLVTGLGEILHIHGRTGEFLEPAPGDAGVNILHMAREGLKRELTTALHRAVTSHEKVSHASLRVKTNGDYSAVHLTVTPVAGQGTGRPDLFLVLLEKAAELPASPTAKPDQPVDASHEGRLAALEQELRAKDEYLQSTIEEMETSNEELKSTNEELQSVNEELQSAVEELETSKEELQSVNEELSTVNAELQMKVMDLSRANNDMNNLLAGTGIGTVFVDHELRVARFTPTATQAINLIPSDVGRPLRHIVSNLSGYDRLMEDIAQVLETLIPFETEVQTTEGSWYLMRVRPYRTLENVIEGAVITFVDLKEQRLKPGGRTRSDS